MTHLSSRRAGFSLIEIVIAVAIFAFAILVIVGLMGSSLKVTRDSEEKIQAANLAVVIAARYRAMLESDAKGQGVKWDKTPFDKNGGSGGPGLFTAPASGPYVDDLGNSVSDAADAAFGIKTAVWKDTPLTSNPGAKLVHCSIQLAWPTAAVATKGQTNTYTMTTAFAIVP